jgi:small conductance mechanosensitive channel
MDMQQIQTFLGTTAIDVGLKVLAAIAFWVVGRWLINLVVGLMQRAMNRNHVDPTLTKYLGSIVAVMLSIALVLGILGYFGIQTTSFAALIAGAGVAIGGPGSECSATSPPARSCSCCGRSRWATSSPSAASPARSPSWACSPPP